MALLCDAGWYKVNNTTKYGIVIVEYNQPKDKKAYDVNYCEVLNINFKVYGSMTWKDWCKDASFKFFPRSAPGANHRTSAPVFCDLKVVKSTVRQR